MKTVIVFFATLNALADSHKSQKPMPQANESLKFETELFRIQDYKIDNKYFAGNYLIYDCEDSHFACVNEIGYADCNENREIALHKKGLNLPCAPLKIFIDKKSCVENSYKFVDSHTLKRFCFSK